MTRYLLVAKPVALINNPKGLSTAVNKEVVITTGAF
jgi:hypothetical protein